MGATLKDKCAELAKKVAEADQAIAELTAAEEAATTKVSTDTEHQSLASKEVEAASQRLGERESSLADSRANFEAHGPILLSAHAELQKYEDELQNFECYTLEVFKSLRDASGSDAQKHAAEVQAEDEHAAPPAAAESKVPMVDAGAPMVDVVVGGA